LHNLALAFIGLMILWTMPIVLFPLYTNGAGVLIKDVEQSSGLFGGNGLQPGYLVTAINGCKVRNTTEWLQCLSSIRMHGSDTGYVMKHEDVVQMLATPNFVKQYGDEIQCCEGFSNQTFASHLCFNYYFDYVTKRPISAEELQKSAPAPFNSTPAVKSFGLFGRNISNGGFGPIRDKRSINQFAKPPTTLSSSQNATQVHHKLNYACLSARQVTSQKSCVQGIVSQRT